jgi:hypothetical protein
MGPQTLSYPDMNCYSVGRTGKVKEKEGVKMLNPTLSEWVVYSRFQDAQAEAEHRRLVESARSALMSQQRQRQRQPKSRVLKRLVASLGYTGQ